MKDLDVLQLANTLELCMRQHAAIHVPIHMQLSETEVQHFYAHIRACSLCHHLMRVAQALLSCAGQT